MPRFRYLAVDSSGREVSAELEADSWEEAASHLEAEGLSVRTLERIEESKPVESGIQLTEKDFQTIGNPLADMTRSGLPLESGLRALSEEVPSRKMRRTLRTISERLATGESLENIVGDTRSGLPTSMRELFRAGIETGRLGILLDAYLSLARRSSEVRMQVMSGLAYSAILVVGFTLVVICYTVWLVPQFGQIFDGFDMELPVMTASLVGLSKLLNNPITWINIGILLLLLILGATIPWLGKPIRRRMFCSIPLIGTSFRNSSLSAFCHLLALMVENQVPLSKALRTAGAGSRDAELEAGCSQLASDLEQGAGLETAAAYRREFPNNLLHVFRWSNRDEIFPEALNAAGEIFEGQARIQAGLVSLIIEPVVLIGVALSMGWIVISLVMPLTQLWNDMGF